MPLSAATKQEIKEIVKEANGELLMTLGLDVGEPKKHQEDMIFLRNMRNSSRETKSTARVYLVNGTLMAIIYLICEGVKSFFSKGS